MGRLLTLAALAALAGCRSVGPAEPPRPPSPASISKNEPGGDAPDPELAALERLGREPWGLRSDRKGMLLAPLTDAAHWRRVRFWLIPAFTGFRYGDDHHGLAAVFIRPLPAPAAGDARGAGALCLDDFERWALPTAQGFGAEVERVPDAQTSWRGKPLAVRRLDGEISWLLRRRRYAVAYASYAAWPGRCATLAYAFPMNQAASEARAARDRFATEAFGRLVTGAVAPPLP